VNLRQFAADLRRLPRVVALKVAEAAAPELTDLGKQTFGAGTTPDGRAWAPGKGGKRILLYRTGALEAFIRYVASGAKLRVSIGVPYAKYQIGKRPVYPRQGAPLPPEYVQALHRAAVRVVKEELHR
jgi:hypothetical protein